MENSVTTLIRLNSRISKEKCRCVDNQLEITHGHKLTSKKVTNEMPFNGLGKDELHKEVDELLVKEFETLSAMNQLILLG